MQETRQRILEIIKLRGQATVNELTRELGLTAVTIRHHLDVLHREGLIGPPQILRKAGPGRPQHVYRLAGEAEEFFPKKYDRLTDALLEELESRMSPEELSAVINGVAERMARQVSVEGDLSARLGALMEFLNGLGYLATAEKEDSSYRITVANCPYERVARRHGLPCQVDTRLIALVTGVEPEHVQQIAVGDEHCVYRLAMPEG
ncbi:MAG: ArsR family transcriptional regulator [Anaerolineae bacterium]|nr:ArsR family transcriptional regulator [Anaerolineae bacterium]MDW8069778.1 ArsR family transcriptional regulator [Anaerolineae bacterium]